MKERLRAQFDYEREKEIDKGPGLNSGKRREADK